MTAAFSILDCCWWFDGDPSSLGSRDCVQSSGIFEGYGDGADCQGFPHLTSGVYSPHPFPFDCMGQGRKHDFLRAAERNRKQHLLLCRDVNGAGILTELFSECTRWSASSPVLSLGANIAMALHLPGRLHRSIELCHGLKLVHSNRVSLFFTDPGKLKVRGEVSLGLCLASFPQFTAGRSRGF